MNELHVMTELISTPYVRENGLGDKIYCTYVRTGMGGCDKAVGRSFKYVGITSEQRMNKYCLLL